MQANSGLKISSSTRTGPLEGVTVLDLTQIMAGPYCTMLLADMGAKVIKVEKPGGGDDSRRMGPPFIKGESLAFLGLNRNKKSAVLDLKEQRGVEAVKRMARKSDVLVENWRPGAMDRLGLGYGALSAENPALIYCSISGFGLTGPYAERGGFDLIAQGMSGLMSITGEPRSPPVKVGVPMADLNAGTFAAFGIVSAYVHRLRTGQGQHIETSLLEAALAYTVYESAMYLNTGAVSGPLGSAHRLSAPYQALRARDGYINIGAANQSNWEKFASVIARRDLLADSRFATNAARLQNQQALAAELEKTLSTRTRAEWLAALEKAGVPAGPIYDMAEVWADPQVKAREMRVDRDHPVAGRVSHIGVPLKLTATPGRIRTTAPALGQHTDEVLAWAEYSQHEIASLRKDGVAQGERTGAATSARQGQLGRNPQGR